ncbi:LysR family transcriptional regulator [Ottowia sp.]|mgnify:FL=1|uniref:LysR family transcriptional regulator n=1 Tax=Ottowia sp. TaxID=1898956 RepID=UPI002C3CC48D|nr:LysR family transcriptional regulator [Ottowia sp.]HRN75775.1 LysR family transcriptional regulator [Ottowia sp.]HRQ04003.1 LysR family transcriptional regulator [Ottowia sp.]
MDSLDLIQTFREVARRGSFSAAARALDMSPANVSKYVAALEKRFDVRLFNRTTRKVSLTDAGELLYERSGPVLELVQMTASELQERATRPSGRLTVTAPHALAHAGLPALMGRYLTLYPEVSLNLRLSNRQVDLVEDGVDLALRVGPIRDQNLIVRRLAPLERVLVASPAYLHQHGVPEHPRDLVEHRALNVNRAGEPARWAFVERGKPFEVALQPHVDVNDVSPLLTLALMDVGIAYMALPLARPHLESGKLVKVLEPFVPQDFWVFAAYMQRRHNSAALMALLQHLENELSRPDSAFQLTPKC